MRGAHGGGAAEKGAEQGPDAQDEDHCRSLTVGMKGWAKFYIRLSYVGFLTGTALRAPRTPRPVRSVPVRFCHAVKPVLCTSRNPLTSPVVRAVLSGGLGAAAAGHCVPVTPEGLDCREGVFRQLGLCPVYALKQQREAWANQTPDGLTEFPFGQYRHSRVQVRTEGGWIKNLDYGEGEPSLGEP